METLPTEEELALERAKNIELRLALHIAKQKAPENEAIRKLDSIEAKQEAIELYREKEKDIFVRLLMSEQLEDLEGVKV